MNKDKRLLQTLQLLPNAHFSNSHRGRVYSVDGLSPALNVMSGGGRVIMIELPVMDKEEISDNGFGEDVIGPLRTAIGRKMAESGIRKAKRIRIRKLTPKECFRLMDVSEPDIDKIQGAGICKTQQYKLAGNSIVVSCLYHVFRKMFCD